MEAWKLVLSLGKRGEDGLSLAALRVQHMTGLSGIIKHMTKACMTRLYESNCFLYCNCLHARLPTDLDILVDKFHVLRA